MSFKIENPHRVVQFPGDTTSTYYVGQIVSFTAASKAAIPGAVVPLAVASGVADLANQQVIAGVVVGFNNRTPVYDATLKANSAGGTIVTQAQQLARDWALNKGMYVIGDPQLLIDVAIIDPCSLIEGPIFAGAYGTACVVGTDTGGADTTGYTTAGTTTTLGFTGVNDFATVYCRTGANAGLYRTLNSTSATAPDVEAAFPFDVVAGDTFVGAPLKQGFSYIYIAGPGMYIDQSASPATNYFEVIVEKVDLKVAGSEKALFRFCPQHFNFYRPTSA
jgi:hypothetical protein